MAVAEIYARNVSQLESCFSCDTFSSFYSCFLFFFLFARAIVFRVFFFWSLLVRRGESGRNSREDKTNFCLVFISLIDLWLITEY